MILDRQAMGSLVDALQPAFWILFLFVVTGCEGGGELPSSEEAPLTQRENLVLQTLDGLAIAGTFQAARGATQGPAVLLLHTVGEGRSSADTEALFAAFVESGHSVLAIDFRSHGKSDQAEVSLFELESDSDQLRWDVQAALAHLQTMPSIIHEDRIGVVGLALGGSLALVARHESDGSNTDWGARSAAAISSRLGPTQRLTPDGDESLSLSEVFFLAGAEHQEDAAEANALFDMATAPKELLLIEGASEHAGELLSSYPETVEQIVSWANGQLEL